MVVGTSWSGWVSLLFPYVSDVNVGVDDGSTTKWTWNMIICRLFDSNYITEIPAEWVFHGGFLHVGVSFRAIPRKLVYSHKWTFCIRVVVFFPDSLVIILI